MSLKYILDGHTPVRCDDLMVWAEWIEKNNRHVALDYVRVPDGLVKVSTVFLGINHNFSEDGPPILFETMVFNGAMDQHQERYSTWEDAELGHQQILFQVQQVEELERMHANPPTDG